MLFFLTVDLDGFAKLRSNRLLNSYRIPLVGGPAVSHASTTGWPQQERAATCVAEGSRCRDSCRASVALDQS